MIDRALIRRQLVHLVEAALDAAHRPEELLDVSRAANALGDRKLLDLVADRLAQEVRSTLDSSSAWAVQSAHSKDAWTQTGHKAAVLAEAWGALMEAQDHSR